MSVKLIDSVFRTAENYHPQEFLGECRYVIKEKKMPNYITDNVEFSSDEEHSDEEDFDKKIVMKKIIVRNKCLFWKSNFKNVFWRE